MEKKIDQYKKLVKDLMADPDIQKDLESNPTTIPFDEFQALKGIRKPEVNRRDIRSLL